MKCLLIVGALCVSLPSAHGQELDTIEFEDATWRVSAQEVRVDRHLGREALFLSRGRLRRDDIVFTDGVIEFDVAFDEGQGFIGPMWRAASDTRFEELYFRTHLSENPDTVQYTPVENGLSAWQIFTDGNAQAATSLKFGAWNHVKIVVKGDAADFYFNADKPQLHIPDLKTDIAAGGVGLRVSGQAGIGRFSNIVFRPLKKGEGLIGAPVETPPLPDGVINKWQVSAPFAEADVEHTLILPKNITNDHSWSMLTVETNGIANLAKLAGTNESENTVFARLNIMAQKSMMKELRFGYSDRVRIYLNGKRVFSGNAGWRERDYRFLGTVGFFDSVGLDLEQGDNELLFAVSETFGGWAVAGVMSDQSGVTLE